MRMMEHGGCDVWRPGLLAVVLVCVVAGQIFAQGGASSGGLDAKTALEMRYVDGLNRMGLNAYAELVLEKLGSGPEVKLRRLQGAMARGEFEDAIRIIAAEPDQGSLSTLRMRRSLGDAYFAWGKYPEARAEYDAFFARFAGSIPEDLKEFYLDSAYTYAQMMLLINDHAAASAAYRKGIAANPIRDVKRQFMGGLADALMKQAEKATVAARATFLRDVEEIANELMWKQDLWFGRAIVMRAHVNMLRGDIDGAMKLVDDYRDALVALDENLVAQSTHEEDFTRLSPMAEARYLIGTILLDEAKRALERGDRSKVLELLTGKDESRGGQATRRLPGALQHFVNVFVKYPNTPWAGDAAAKYEETVEILAKLGKRINAKITPEQWAKVEIEQMKTARALLNQQKYAEAADQYLALLTRTPEGYYALDALAELGTCYVEMEEDLYADVVINYIAERFNKKPNLSARAGDLVLRFGRMYLARKKPERKEAIYEVYFDNFKSHALAAQLLNTAGDRRFATNNYAGAIDYYQRVVSDHAQSPVSYEAMSRMAACYERLGDTTNQLATIKTYIARATKANRVSHDLIRMIFRQANAYQAMGPKYYPKAMSGYTEIEKRLNAKREDYQRNKEEADQNQELLEWAMYYKAVCFARGTPPPGKPENLYKQAALQHYQKLADAYPKSKVAPSALSQVGTLWTLFDKSDEAQKAFTRLKTDYPDSPEARNVDFLLANSLLKLDKRKEAIPIFKAMFAGEGGKYTETQVLSAGTELFKAKEYEIAVEAFDRVLAGVSDGSRALREPALARKGIALAELKRYAEAAEALALLFAEYPRTSFTVAAAAARSRACAELGGVEANPEKRLDYFNAAVDATKTAIKHDKSASRRGEATVEIGRIYELKAKAEADHGSAEKAKDYRKEAIANYQILTLFENPDDPEMRPHLELAYHKLLAQYVDLEMWQDVYTDSDTYLKAFPDGPHALDIRQWRSRANAQLAAEGGPHTEAAP